MKNCRKCNIEKDFIHFYEKSNSKTYEMLQCSFGELMIHLNNNEYGFVYGEDNLDLDHIIPLATASSKEELIELNHYTNLQLLPSDYNRHIKSDREFNKEELELCLQIKTVI
jgi:hypothetical protein